MENAPLNLAHFYERRAEKYIKRHNYDEAITYLEKSIFYISEAYKSIQMPVSAKVLDAQNWDYKRKIAQLKLRKINDGIQSTDDAQFSDENNFFKSLPEMKISIEKTLEDIDIKYKLYIEPKLTTFNNSSKEINSQKNVFVNKKDEDWLREIESNDFPCLAPLELPTFEFDVFKTKSSDSIKEFLCSSNIEPNDK